MSERRGQCSVGERPTALTFCLPGGDVSTQPGSGNVIHIGGVPPGHVDEYQSRFVLVGGERHIKVE